MSSYENFIEISQIYLMFTPPPPKKKKTITCQVFFHGII